MSITLILVALTVVVSIMAFNDNDLKYKLTFSPYSVKHHNRWWLIFTHGVVHADYTHLAMNMFTLYFMGEGVENIFMAYFGTKGALYYVLLYLGGLFFATMPSFMKHADDPGYMSVGASGAVSAVVFAFILFAPLAPLQLMFIPIGIPAVIVGVGFVVYESYANRNMRTNIAHDAHLAGAAFGVVFLLILDYRLGVNFLNQILSVFS